MNIALVLSGGSGSRIGGDIPKQYLMVGGQMIITYCLKELAKHDEIAAIQIVADQSRQDDILAEMNKCHLDIQKFIGFSEPGATRQLSILNGLRDIRQYMEEERQFTGEEKDDNAWVMIHDAARPMLTGSLIDKYLSLADDNCDGLMPVLPMKNAVYYSESGNEITGLLKRSTLYIGQSPELYKLDVYLDANEALGPEEIYTIVGSAEPAHMAGMKVKMISGDESNFKINTIDDLEKFKEMIEK